MNRQFNCQPWLQKQSYYFSEINMIRWRHVDYIKACLITFVLNNQSEYISNYAEYPNVIIFLLWICKKCYNYSNHYFESLNFVYIINLLQMKYGDLRKNHFIGYKKNLLALWIFKIIVWILPNNHRFLFNIDKYVFLCPNSIHRYSR